MTVSVYLSKTMKEEVKQAAKKDRRSVSGFIQLAISNQISIKDNQNDSSRRSSKKD